MFNVSLDLISINNIEIVSQARCLLGLILSSIFDVLKYFQSECVNRVNVIRRSIFDSTTLKSVKVDGH